MTGEPTHTTSEMAQHATVPYRLKSELSIMLHCQLCSTHCRPRGQGPAILSGPGRHVGLNDTIDSAIVSIPNLVLRR